jgi:hypothetical protein
MDYKEYDWRHDAVRLANTSVVSWRGISRELGVPRSTVSDYLRAYFKTLNGDRDTSEYLIPKGAKILLFDVECAPTTAYTWGRWDQNVSQKQVVKEGYLLTYSAKWLGEPAILSNRIVEQGKDDNLIYELADLMNKADLLVAHNALKFDVPLIKTRMLALGLDPLLPSKVVDTLRIAKAEFRFPSNSLDSIAAYLDLPRKKSHSGFELWTRCMNMEDDAFAEMLEYNIQDVIVLEQLYLRLRAWSKTHPNVALHEPDDKVRCVCCGSENLEESNKSYFTSVSEYNVLVCKDCGKTNRTRKSMSKRENLLTNVGK